MFSRAILPGLALSGALALLARLVAPATPLPAVFWALLAGLGLSRGGRAPALTPGVAFAVKPVLRLGVALLGAQVTLGSIREVGAAAALLAVGVLLISLVLGVAVARRLGLSRELAWLTAASVSICGASAAMAVAAVLPRSETVERNAAATVAGITVIGTLAMILFPLATAAAGLDARAAGVFLGGSLHEVVQAVGAGFAVSEEAGAAATTTKLVRVACLGPLVLWLGWRTRAAVGATSAARPPLVPLFLLGFLALATLASLGLVPASLIAILAEASRLCLLTAIAALGLKLSVTDLARLGVRPQAALLTQSALIAGLMLLGSLLFASGSLSP